jgi:2-amino-4-hydroxy-6-hydroxymethyldihydropteridine diphosphokinase
MNRAIIAVGSNIYPLENVNRAIDILCCEQTVLYTSKFLWTKPVGYQQQPDFYNGAVYIATKLKQAELKQYLKSIEVRLKRIKTAIKSGPRTIDLDIIVWNQQVVDNDIYQPYIYEPMMDVLQANNLRDVERNNLLLSHP